MSKRIQRPRLEHAAKYDISGEICVDADQDNELCIQLYDQGDAIKVTLPEAKRLHKFLGRAIAYLESRARK